MLSRKVIVLFFVYEYSAQDLSKKMDLNKRSGYSVVL